MEEFTKPVTFEFTLVTVKLHTCLDDSPACIHKHERSLPTKSIENQTMIQLDTLSLFRNPEIRVRKPSGEEVLHMYRCANHDAVVKLVHSSSVNLTVKMWGKFNSPPFLASYVGVSGGLRAGELSELFV